ncbi:AAA ATPase [Gracilaria domingensis]|nr:AAA ATPase [Gracilaria domingensis]
MEIDTPEPRQDGPFHSGFWDVVGEVIPSIAQLSSESSTYTLAKAFSSPELTPLHVYRAASYLPEGVLREVVQILTYEPSNVAPAAARLLSIMRGLPGNLELALLFYQQHIKAFPSFDLRIVTLFAFVCGPLLHSINDWGPVIRKAVGSNCAESKLALSCLYEINIHEPIEPLTHIYGWESEFEHAKTPSFWRELRWASFSRSLVSSNVPPLPRSFQYMNDEVIANIPLSYGNAAPHYVRICGNLFPRKAITGGSTACEDVVEVEPEGDEYKSPRIENVVVTQSVRCAIETVSDYLAYGVSFILEGPTGCGKTTILSYLGREILHSRAKSSDDSKVPGVTFIQMDNTMISSDGESFTSLVGEIVPLPEGGGFTWRPGPIGIAAQRGDWLVFENICRGDRSMSSALPILLQLANAEPGDSLDAPGRGEPIRIAKGFRCIATRSTSQSDADDSWEPPGGWNIWKRVRMQGLSAAEKVDLLKMGFASIKDCVERVVAAVDEVGRALSVENAVKDSYEVLGASCYADPERESVLRILGKSWSLGPEVVRDLCLRHRPTMVRDKSFVGIGRAAYQQRRCTPQRFTPKLSINGHTSRLLESAQTSIVQELASLLNQELLVVNLSRQSDLSDLIGGFKPMELENVVPALGKRFEKLFCQVMSREKNTRFLDGLQRACSCSQKYDRAIQLMNGALKKFPKNQKSCGSAAFTRVGLAETVCDASVSNSSTGNRTKPGEPPRKRPRSSSYYGGTKTHDSLPPNSDVKKEKKKKLGFTFSEGILVKAMREGKWILLDEINLGPPELLERLVSIMDRGEVVLGNENGDVVSQNPGFFLFGAMNPPTDVGKRCLPEVLRSRFSEIYVGDMIEREDIVDLVISRFFRARGRGEAMGFSMNERLLAHDITSFYIESFLLAREGRIEDNIGRPMKFSIRTLARMLDFGKDVDSVGVGDLRGIRRILYEGALLAFCTALPATSRAKVVHLARQFILRYENGETESLPEMASTIRSSRKYGGQLQIVQGFPLEKRTSSSESFERPTFVVSTAVSSTLKDVCRALVIGAPPLPILLQGPTAAGKTSMVAYLARLTGNKLIRINNHEHTDLSEYIGGYVATKSGSLVFSEGPLIKAARNGDWVMLDELNLAPPDVLESLNRLLDDNREVFIPETGETVKAVPGFRLFATQNPPGLYGGRKELSNAFRSRFVEITVEELPDQDLLFILEKRSGIPQSFARKMVAVMRELQVKRKVSGLFSGREGFVTARDLFRWASRLPRSKEELAVHGFFLLGERCRIPSERDTVRNVLIKHTGALGDVLSDESLYSLGTSSKPATAADESLYRSLQLLSLSSGRLKESLTKMGIALTPTTRRMLTLALHCIAYNEPVLLVGTTGGGKTTVCSAICDAMFRKLLTVNCHQHTESSDLLGGFRPVRRRGHDEGVFEWSDGPLVQAMRQGCSFLIDEINMAEDAVIERLNSVLEPERSLLLSERGAIPNSDNSEVEPELVEGHINFRILATMNPGGDYGKRELSPALRNRFTEVWIPKPGKLEDFVPIIDDRFKDLLTAASAPMTGGVTKIMIQFLEQSLKEHHSHPTSSLGRNLRGAMEFHISLRDLRAWCDFVVNAVNNCKIDPVEALMHGARVVFLDGLSVGGTKTGLEEEETRIWYYLLSLASPEVLDRLRKCRYDVRSGINLESDFSGDGYAVKVDSFVLDRNYGRCTNNSANAQTRFCFKAPSTKRNVARLTRSLAVSSRPILLEGPPGSGKSSLISAMADLSGNDFIRINLSESTEMSDLVGTDAPDSTDGSFKFCEGPLLNAMKHGSWVLLDELNLASQSVLEGLNSILDHRRTVFIPETNQVVSAHKNFRVFGAQNPVHGGGGRRGLPQSFLNRFTRVIVDLPSDEDILHIIESIFSEVPNHISKNIVRTLARMRTDNGIASDRLTDFGLRDALRWCDVLCRTSSSWIQSPGSFTNLFDSKEFIRMSFDVSVLQGLREAKMHQAAEAIFKEVFGFGWCGEVGAPSLKAAGTFTRVGFGSLTQIGNTHFIRNLEPRSGILGISQLRPLQAITIAVEAGWPVVLLSGTNGSADEDGKRMVHFVGMSCGKKIRTFHGSSLVDSEALIGGYSQRGGARYMLQIITMAQELLPVMITSSVFSDKSIHGRDERASIMVEAQNHFRSMSALFDTSADHDGFLKSQYEQRSGDIEKFASEADGFVRNARLMLEDDKSAMYSVNCMASHNTEVWKMASRQKFETSPSFEWKKSELLKAIERGDWIFIQGAEMCPPAVLDRLNPLFERPAVSPEDLDLKPEEQHRARILLAEAKSEEGGSPIFLTPHPDFRIFFAVSRRFSFTDTQGLSRPLLDRSLRICLGNIVMQESTSHEDALSSISYGQAPHLRLSRPVYLERKLAHTERKTSLGHAEEFQIETVGAMPTRYADFILHPELSCLDIDHWNFIRTMREPERNFEAAANAVVMASTSILKGMESATPYDAAGSVELTFLYRRELLYTMQQEVILASANAKDAMSRTASVKKVASALSSSDIKVDDAFEAAVNSVLSTVPLETDKRALSCSIDPIYAMDRLPTEIILSTADKSLRERLGNKAILFRAEIFAFYRFQETWKRAISMSRTKNQLAHARLKSQISGSGQAHFERDADVSVVCFDLLTSAASNLELTRRALLKVDGWQHPYEAEIYHIYDNLRITCELMVKEETSAASLWALLHTLSRIWTKLCNATDLDSLGLDALRRWMPRIWKLDIAIQCLTCSSNLSLMPRLKQAQLAEKRLLEFLQPCSSLNLLPSEVDIAVKAVATLSSRLIEGNTAVIDRLASIPDSLKPRFESNYVSSWNQALVQFRSVVRFMAVISMEDCLSSNLDISQSSLQGPIVQLRKAVESLWSKVRCIPFFRLESLVAIMRLLWLLDSSDKDLKRTKLKPIVDGIEQDLFLLTFLQEVNDSGAPGSSSGAAEVGVDSNPVKATIGFLRDPQHYLFWNLETAYHQAAVTSGMFALHSRMSSPSGDASIRVLLRAISSAMRLGQLKTEAERILQGLNHGCFQDVLAYVASLTERQDSDKSGDSGSHCQLEDANLALSSVVQAIKVSSASEKGDIEDLRSRGTAWMAIGVFRIQTYLSIFDCIEGIDPSVLTEKIATLSLETKIKLEARRKAYEILQTSRLGGDEFLGSVPAQVLSNQLQEEEDNLATCSSCYVYRDPDEVSFKSFAGVVQGVKSNIIAIMKKNGFVGRAKQFGSGRLPLLIPEALHLIEICKTTSGLLGFQGSHSHFRDLSLRLRLGIEEIHHGLRWLLQSTELIGIRENPGSYKKVKGLSDLCFLPRACFRNARELPDAFSLCAEIAPHSRALMVTAQFLLENDSFTHDRPFLHISEYLSRIVKIWKVSVEQSEVESDRRESLHVIRQSSQRHELTSTSFLEISEQQEVEDFISTFNPVGNDIEDDLLGIRVESDICLQEQQIEVDAYENQDETFFEINPSDFWALHQSIFPASQCSNTLFTRPSVQPSAETLLAFATALSGLVKEEIEPVLGSEIVNGIWGFLCSLSVTRAIHGVQDPGEDEAFHVGQSSSYNFYKDPNVREVQHAATVLLKLRSSIEKIQQLHFGDSGKHPVLDGITLAIERVAKVSRSSTPLSIVVVGLENVLRRADEWNRLFASRQTKLHTELIAVSKLVSRWRRIEMHSWPLLLTARKNQFETQANKWVFLVYDAVINESLTTKKLDDEQLNTLFSTIDRFLRSSPSGEFRRRLAILQSISQHLLSLNDTRKDLAHSIAHGLRGICRFYYIFDDHLDRQLSKQYELVLQELKEFTTMVSYNPLEELGSAVEMSKGRDKNLDYFRLKALSEKTRRRIHKLCLKVDSILRVPFYQHMKEFTASIGLSHLEMPSLDPKIDSVLAQVQDDSMKIFNAVLCVEGLNFDSRNISVTLLPAAAKWLSRFDTLQKRLGEYGRKIQSSSQTECDVASEFSSGLRKVIQSRVRKLREMRLGNDIQPKRRALIDLLKGLLKVGLSPFEKPHANSFLSWLSTVEPSSSGAYNELANDLYFSGIYRYQTLCIVSDSSSRNNDISAEEASRIRAFCRDLLEKSATERRELNRCSTILLCMSKIARALTNASEYTRGWKCSNPTLFKHFRELLLRLRKAQLTLRQVSTLIREAQGNLSGFVDFARGDGSLDQVLASYRKIGSKSMTELQAILNTCCDKIEDEPRAIALMDIDEFEYQELSYFDGRYEEWCDKMRSYLSSLKESLQIGISRSQEISRDNLVTEVLVPLRTLVEEYQNEDIEAVLPPSSPEETSSALCNALLINAEELVESLLISSQKAMAWNGVSENGEEAEPKETLSLFTAETELFPSGSIRKGHSRTINLTSDLLLTQLTSRLEANTQALRKLVPLREFLSGRETRELIGIQKALGLILKEYLTSMLSPCLEKAIIQHRENLALLRTLTSLFIGICKDGFCRPKLQEETDGTAETEVKSGTGFGDVGDGDLSGAQDVSDAIEDEEQLLGLRDDKSREPEQNPDNAGNENGFEMTADFEGNLEDVDDTGEQNMDDDPEAEKQMGQEQEKGENVLNEKLWDSENEASDRQEADHDSDDGRNEGHSKSNGVPGEWAVGGKKDDNQIEGRDKQNGNEVESLSDAPGVEEETKKTTDDETETCQDAENQEAEMSKDAENDSHQEMLDDENGLKDPAKVQETAAENDNATLEQEYDVPDVSNNDDVQDQEPGPSNEEKDQHIGDTESNHGSPMIGADEQPELGEDAEIEEKTSGDFPENCRLSDLEEDGDLGKDEIKADEELNHTERGATPEPTSTPEEEVKSKLPVAPESIPDRDQDRLEPLTNNNAINEADTGMNQSVSGTEPRAMNILPGLSTTNQTDDDIEDNAEPYAHQGHGTLGFGSNMNDVNGEQDNIANSFGHDNHSGPDSHENVNKSEEGIGAQKLDSSLREGDEQRKGSSSMDINPLRLSDPEDLIREWDECLRALRDDDEQWPRQGDGENDADMWQFETTEDRSENPHHALGAASQEQQRPLPEASVPDIDNGSIQDKEQERIPQPMKGIPKKDVPENNFHQMQSSSSHDSDDNFSQPVQVQKPHPARSAASRQQESNRTASNQIGGSDSDPLEICDEKDSDSPEMNEDPKPVRSEVLGWTMENLDDGQAKGLWHALESKVASDAAALCEQMRLVLEPTKASRMGGAYRTGKRLNMRKVIEYVASDFRRDRIWLRRVKPDKRSYDVLIAVDDSASMVESEAGIMATESIALVISALSKLEVGRIAVASFGSTAKLIRHFEEPLPVNAESGAKILQHFSFSQTETNIVNLLTFIHSQMGMKNDDGTVEHISLAFIISDGRLSDRDEVRRQLRKLKESNVLVAFFILDRGAVEENSIYNVQRVEYNPEGKMSVKPYMHDFPIDFYAVVQNMKSLPGILADALRQWIEVTNYQ